MAEEDETGIPIGNATIRDRIAAFEMLDRMADATQGSKIYRLSLVGFKRNEIAAMMRTSLAVVSQSIYEQKNKAKTTTKRPTKSS